MQKYEKIESIRIKLLLEKFKEKKIKILFLINIESQFHFQLVVLIVLLSIEVHCLSVMSLHGYFLKIFYFIFNLFN